MIPTPILPVLPAGEHLCDYYPTSRAVSALVEPFREGVESFLLELSRRGCSVEISATYRPPERAYLMQVAWDVADGTIAPDAVPDHDPPLPFRVAWTVAGAREMVRTYALRHRPVLLGRHQQRRAIDMHVTGWTGTDRALWDLGASFGVHKLVTDVPHWSDDGH